MKNSLCSQQSRKRIKPFIYLPNIIGARVSRITTNTNKLMFPQLIGDGPLSVEGFPGRASGKASGCQCKRHKRHRFDPWVGKLPEGRHGNPLQYSCLENPMDRVAWQVTVHRSQSWTRLKRLNMQNSRRWQF